MRMYHGGTINFTSADNALYGAGLYVSPRRALAEVHAYNGEIHEIEFNLENPYIVGKDNREEFFRMSESGVTAAQKSAILSGMGYDGVQVMDAEDGIQEVVIFSKKSLNSQK